jgi:hypothetical protein
MIPREVIENEDQEALDSIAAEAGLELDHRKTFPNQVVDVENRIKFNKKEAARKKEEALKDPRNWKLIAGFKLSKFWGPNPNGGVYIQSLDTGLQFFVPAEKIKEYRAD